jgi:capsular polysaccharide biosynthesis protein
MFGLQKQKVFNGGRFQRKLPENLMQSDRFHFESNMTYSCPDLFVYFFASAFALPDSSLFLFRFWPVSRSFPFFRKRIKIHSVKGVFDIQRKWKQKTFKNERGYYLIIHDQWTQNYYHWMTQALPRLILAMKTGKSFHLLMPQDHSFNFHKQTLQALGIDQWTVFGCEKQYLLIEPLMYPSHDIQIGDYHDDLMRDLARLLRSKSASSYGSKRIFIHRSSRYGRLILNEEEVITAFQTWGFEIINFEKLDFLQQVALAKSASIMAGVHGAGLTNMMFMKPGSKILELTSALRGEQYYYYTLANAMQHDYFYHYCQPAEANKTIQESNFNVDVAVLNTVLSKMASS